MRRTWLIWLLPAFLAGALTGCLDLGGVDAPPITEQESQVVGGGTSDGGGYDEPLIVMQNLLITPMLLRIAVGTEVTFVNRDTVDHIVHEGDMSKPPEFESPRLGPGDSWKYRFQTKTEYTWHCSTHPTVMVGAKIRVQ